MRLSTKKPSLENKIGVQAWIWFCLYVDNVTFIGSTQVSQAYNYLAGQLRTKTAFFSSQRNPNKPI